jgi:ABC-2 type transport system ATP-binding protein
LDEPASGLDPKARYELSQLLRYLQKQGMTIIVSSHILAELQDYSTHMMVLEQGRMIHYGPLSKDQNMQDIYLNHLKLSQKE